MATLAQKIRCEEAAREMLRRDDLPEPDRVEYGHTCIRLIWEEQKLALVVEIDKPPEGFEVVGEYVDDLEQVGEYVEDLDRGDEDDNEDDDFDYDDAAEELERLDNGDRDEEGQMD